MTELPPPPAWIRWPVRILAVVFVLPFRLLWELLGYLGRFLARYVGRPLAWLWHYAVAVPAAFLWRYLVAVPAAFLWRYLVAVPAAFLWRYLVAVPAAFLWRHLVVVPVSRLWQRVLGPAFAWLRRHRRLLLRPFAVVLHYLLVVPVVWLWELSLPLWRGLGWLLAGLARGVATVLAAGWRGAGWVLGQLYRWVLRPAGRALAWGWRHTVVPVHRVVAAAGRWVREAVLRPAAVTARAVLVSVGLRR
ncbi:hypothetical protein [Actinoplanes sp. NPDC049599]|uniref:hypothetical protein n=1 Tax=Actinoplanes sp. NPDC049599 TaxID=3363903 RepID=UPI00378FBEFB